MSDSSNEPLYYKIPIFAVEAVVVTKGGLRDCIQVVRGEEKTVLATAHFWNLGGRRPTEIHFVDQSLPSGGFRHDAIRVDEAMENLERVDAPPPPATKAARRLMIGRVQTPSGIQFKFTKQ